jgi:hypothetical protein
MVVGFAESLVALQKQQQEAPKAKPAQPQISISQREMSAVYVADEAYAWLPANIVKTEGSQVTVAISLPQNWHPSTIISHDTSIEFKDLEDALLEGKTLDIYRTVHLKDYPRQELPLQNGARSLGKRDMADLPFLHEAAILYNLKHRHYSHQPYTRVGDIVVAMNPFTWMHELYSQKTRDLYATSLVWEGTYVDFFLCTLFGMLLRCGLTIRLYIVRSL